MEKQWKFLPVFLLTTLVATGCVIIYGKSRLTLKNEPFDRQKITFRTDGFYYRETEDYGFIDVGQYGRRTRLPLVGVQPIFFYDDGYLNYEGGIFLPDPIDTLASKSAQLASALNHVENYIRRTPFMVFKKNPHYTVWNQGLYRQRGDSLKMQYYFNALGNYQLMTVDAVVLDDSTIHVINQYGPRSYKKVPGINRPRDDIYKFRQFAFKPDSSNYLRDRIDRFGKKK